MKGQAPRHCLPITPSVFRKIKSAWLSAPDKLILWAAFTTAFFGFCRSGEIIMSLEGTHDPQSHLSFGDLAVDHHSTPLISILFKHSKTNQGRKDVKIVISKTNDDICAVAA